MEEKTQGQKLKEFGILSFRDIDQEVFRLQFITNPLEVGSTIMITQKMISGSRLIIKMRDKDDPLQTYSYPVCWYCGKMTSRWCQNCGTLFCGPTCFRKAWPRHQKVCADNN